MINIDSIRLLFDVKLNEFGLPPILFKLESLFILMRKLHIICKLNKMWRLSSLPLVIVYLKKRTCPVKKSTADKQHPN